MNFDVINCPAPNGISQIVNGHDPFAGQDAVRFNPFGAEYFAVIPLRESRSVTQQSTLGVVNALRHATYPALTAAPHRVAKPVRIQYLLTNSS